MVGYLKKDNSNRGRFILPLWFCLFCFVFNTSVLAAPFTPKDDNQVLEKLPLGSQGRIKGELREIKSEIDKDKNNLELVLLFSRKCIELGRQEADPRYYGYAQSVISHWLNQKDPPAEILALSGIIKQANHDFNGALIDLSKALEKDKTNAQAWITKAQIFQTTGDYNNAKRSCIELLRLSSQTLSTSCVSLAGGLTGSAEKSYEVLKRVVNSPDTVSVEELVWAETILGEISYRLKRNEDCEFHLSNALKLKPNDIYVLAVYSDYLMDQNKPQEVVKLLQNKTTVDSLLLRLAIAEKLLNDPEYKKHEDELSKRFFDAKLRKDSVHLREEAIYNLKLLNDSKKALELALKNWETQKEPIDARVLLEAALASDKKGAAKKTVDFLERNKTEDVKLAELVKKIKE